MVSGPDSIDEFLASLGLEVERAGGGVQRTAGMPETIVTVLFREDYSEKESTYYICCYAKGLADEKLKDRQLRQTDIARWQIGEETLVNVCKRLEKKLDDFQMEYHHDDPPRNLLSPQHAFASYKLVNRMSDPFGKETHQIALDIFRSIIMDYNEGI